VNPTSLISYRIAHCQHTHTFLLLQILVMPAKTPQLKTSSTTLASAQKSGTARWEKVKLDVPLRLLIAPKRPFRGLHLDTVQELKEILRLQWSSSFNMCVLEDKDEGSDLLEVVDGNHRFTALRELWAEGVIDGDYMVGVVIFRKDTPDSILMEAADTVNQGNATFQHMTLLDKIYFIRQVLVRMDEARLAEANKRLPGNLLFQNGTVWDISPAIIHEYLYKNKSDSNTQKYVGLFRSFFGPWDYQKSNVTLVPLNRVSTLYNQLMWLNERSAKWWANFHNNLSSAMVSLNKRADTQDWKVRELTKVEFDADLKPFNERQVDANKAWVTTYTEVLKVTGVLSLKPVYPGIFQNDEYGQRSTAIQRPKFEYIIHRAFVNLALTGKLTTREQYLQYKEEVHSNEVYSRFNLWAALERTRQRYDSTVGGSLWCTASSSPFEKATGMCAWPACKKLLEELASADLQGCNVCYGSTVQSYFACSDCTKAAYDNTLPTFAAGGTFPEKSFTVCPTCFFTLAVRAPSTTRLGQAGSDPSQLRSVWPHPQLVDDTPEGTKDCIRCWVGFGQCNVHETHRGKPFLQASDVEIPLESLVDATRDRVTRVQGRAIFPKIVAKLGNTKHHAEQMEINRILHEVQLACLLPSKNVGGLWRAACHNDLLAPETKWANLERAGLGAGGGGGAGSNDADVAMELEYENSEASALQTKMKEQQRKLALYKASLRKPMACKQNLIPMAWQSMYSRRNQAEYKNQFDLLLFDPMYGVLEQPTQDDFVQIRDMLHAMTKKNATAVVFNNMMNLDLWRKAIEQTPPDKDTAPWHCDPWPMCITRAVQRNRAPKTVDYVKNRVEFAFIFRKAVRSEPGKKARWTRADGAALLEQFSRLFPLITPPNTNVWENYIPPGPHEALYDEKGKRVRALAEKSRALCEMILARFCPIDADKSQTGKVFDFYAGTGVFAIAAKQMGIEYVGTEQDKRVCELAQMRLGAVQEILDSPELLSACGKPHAPLKTFTVPSITVGDPFFFHLGALTGCGCHDELCEPNRGWLFAGAHGASENFAQLLSPRYEGKYTIRPPHFIALYRLPSRRVRRSAWTAL
jgi:hypothetical protein